MEMTYTNSSYPTVLHKKPSPITVGFEWEVPILEEILDEGQDDWGDLDYEYLEERLLMGAGEDLDDMFNDWIIDCGGMEFRSPISGNMNQTKALIRRVKDLANSLEVLEPYKTGHICGIHVHVANNGVDFNQVMGMLNRTDSADFVLKLSGRIQGFDYYRQGVASCWDTKPDHWRGPGPWQSSDMVRDQGWNYGTIEFRLFRSDPDLLDIAVEFSHSVMSFMVKTKPEGVPHLKDWKEWVFKQKGYKVLKQDAPWELLNA